jgi:hypothetical protein
MSGSNTPVTHVAGTAAVTSAAVLPFTHGSRIGMYVLIVAITCAAIVIASKLVKHFATKSL